MNWRLGYRACLGGASAALLVAHQAANQTAALEGTAPAKTTPRDLDLRFVQVVFRHGARAPLTENFGAHSHKWEYCDRAYEAIKVDIRGLEGTDRPVSQSDERQRKVVFAGGCRKGQLTSMGQLQALQLGGWLRERYALERDFLPDSYQPSALKVRSTNISRTLDTATGVLTGLYPDTTDPILIETCDDRREWLYPNHRNCKRLSELIAGKRAQMQKNRRAEAYYKGLEAKLREAIEGEGEGGDPIRFVELFDVCKTVKFHSNKQHHKMSEALMRELELVAVEQMKGFVAPEDNNEMLSLSIGKVIQDLLEGMQHAASGKVGVAKMKLFSGHDTTLMPLLVALGYELKNWPPFMSNLIFELYWSPSDQKHYVKVLYNQEVVRVEGCDAEGLLELPAFHKRLEPFVSHDYSHDCAAVSGPKEAKARAQGGNMGV